MNFGSGYDAWLEQPYRERAEQAERAEAAVEGYAAAFDLDAEDVDEDEALAWWDDLDDTAAMDAAEMRAELAEERYWDE